ncbi:MAG: MerR family transcriptional regulator [Gemmatimonadales bacterium]|nr:MerR family transcriptional regulator [Gemmatimonadales bacterium]MXX78823.1 MerR family transcriptional regulator [Gemmatimonadales bacterium]MYC87602.1 MerR family transcriptional regulator [Candidatus Palauibacter denitrificans]MYE70119.1 MerR family transcriptional regulator [Gemmatimonadota bacterium]
MPRQPRHGPLAREGEGVSDRIAPKEYYSIGEVCEIADLKPHVLRYWETQFSALRPTKNRAGNRVYRPKQIQLVQLLRHLLYTERYTIEGARRKLDQLRAGGELAAQARVAWDRETIRDLRREADELVQLLEDGEAG